MNKSFLKYCEYKYTQGLQCLHLLVISHMHNIITPITRLPKINGDGKKPICKNAQHSIIMTIR